MSFRQLPPVLIARRCPIVPLALVIFAWLTALPALALSPQALMATRAASAQSATIEAPAETALPEPLTPEAVDRFLAGLTDAEARQRLRQLLHAEAEERQRAAAAAAASEPTREGFSAIAHNLHSRLEQAKQHVAEVRRLAAALDHYGWIILMNLTDGEGWPALGRGLAVFAFLLGVGVLAEGAFRRALRGLRRRVENTLATTPLGRLGVFASLVLFDGVALVVFVVAAALPSFAFYGEHDPMRVVIITFVLAIAVARAVHLLAKRMLVGEHCLFVVSPGFGKAMTLWITVIAALVVFNRSMAPTLQLLGLPDVLARSFGLPLATIILTATVLMAWQMRSRYVREQALQRAIASGERGGAPAGASAAYFLFATVFAIAVYAIGIESYLRDQGAALLAYVSLLLVLGAPSLVGLLDRSLKALGQPPAPPQVVLAPAGVTDGALIDGGVTATGAPPPATGGLEQRVHLALLGATYLLILGSAFLLLAEAWLGDVFAWFRTPLGGRLADAALNVYLVTLLAYAGWRLVKGWAQRHIGGEDAAGPGADFDEGMTTVAARSRIATLAPLVRAAAAIFLSATVVMIALSSAGIDIAPLLAGAGVVGLAIGFGAQSLVRDILSGAFFLIDDAFRLGEYIEIDNTLRGQVERITLRSMQLRHHRGALLTLPYGTLRSIINHNRDFAIFKQEFRVPYDTDLEKVRKIIKKIGQELLADPEHGPKFIQPLKSQGVIRIEESALIIRTKFVCKPREQFVLRRVVFQRVQEAFRQAGIQFAVRKVQVQVDKDADEATRREAIAAAAMAAVAEEPPPAKAPPSAGGP